ncbi:MAG: hypothetical protein U0793_05560 [Gemmataceae bacterium]
MRLLSFLLLIPSPLMAQASLYEKAEFSSGRETLPYRLLKPQAIEEGKKYPLVVFLHGPRASAVSTTRHNSSTGAALFTDKANRVKLPAFVLSRNVRPASAGSRSTGARRSRTSSRRSRAGR